MPRARGDRDIVRVLPVTGQMRVPGVVFASDALLPEDPEPVFAQLRAVAALPGIVEAAYAMPDLHVGYGFPIGGVAATDLDEGGVISPGGVGFDISCGVRLHTLPVTLADTAAADRARFVDELARRIPHGTGPGGILETDDAGLAQVLAGGSPVVCRWGYGEDADLARTEDAGCLTEADPAAVGTTARRRGSRQLGSLGGGNHFVELGVVDEVLAPSSAAAFGLAAGQLTVLVHCGSRGLGHQICSDALAVMQTAMGRYGLSVPDAQLACVPATAPEGETYRAAMAAAANFARANRQLITAELRAAARKVFATSTVRVVTDVNHNMARRERHVVDGRSRRLCVHRKGATPSLPPGHPDLPADLARHGQPVIVPGSMGTASWVLAGGTGRAFASTCHGAGRRTSRTQARRTVAPAQLTRDLAAAGVEVRGATVAGLTEEAPEAYKDVDEVVAVCAAAGLSRPVCRLRPLGVVKG